MEIKNSDPSVELVPFDVRSFCCQYLDRLFLVLKSASSRPSNSLEEDSKSAAKNGGEFFGGSDGISPNQFGSVTDMFFSQIQFKGSLFNSIFFSFFVFSMENTEKFLFLSR